MTPGLLLLVDGDNIICLYLHYLDIEDRPFGRSPYFVEASNGVDGWFLVGGVRCDGVMATVLFWREVQV